MSKRQAIRAYLDELAKALEAGSPERDRILAEAEDHLVETVERLRADGISPDEAARVALARFGSPREVAARFVMERKVIDRGMRNWQLVGPIGAAVLVLIAAGVLLVGNRGSEREAIGDRGQNPKSKAFTAVKVLTVYNESGEIGSFRTQIEAFRSDGSKFSMSPTRNGGVASRPRSPELRFIEDRTQRLTAMLLPEQRLVSSLPFPDTATRAWSYPEPRMCSFLLEALDSDPESERAVMLGYEVRKHTFGAGGSNEVWVAPDLDCYEMRSTIWRTDPDSHERRVVGESETVFVAKGEPPSEYFALPAGFRECPPSEIFRAASKPNGVASANHANEADRRFYQLADERYRRIRNRQR